jgi:hypothetical protein
MAKRVIKLPYINNKDLYAATMSCIKSIESGYPKASSIRNAAKWRGVKQTELRPIIDNYFGAEFFEMRRKPPKGSRPKTDNRRSQIMIDYSNIKHFRSI